MELWLSVRRELCRLVENKELIAMAGLLADVRDHGADQYGDIIESVPGPVSDGGELNDLSGEIKGTVKAVFVESLFSARIHRCLNQKEPVLPLSALILSRLDEEQIPRSPPRLSEGRKGRERTPAEDSCSRGEAGEALSGLPRGTLDLNPHSVFTIGVNSEQSLIIRP